MIACTPEESKTCLLLAKSVVSPLVTVDLLRDVRNGGNVETTWNTLEPMASMLRWSKTQAVNLFEVKGRASRTPAHLGLGFGNAAQKDCLDHLTQANKGPSWTESSEESR